MVEESLDQEELEDWLLLAATQRVLNFLRREIARSRERAIALLQTASLEELRTVGADIRALERTLKIMKGETK
jgi:hypothetical protein